MGLAGDGHWTEDQVCALLLTIGGCGFDVTGGREQVALEGRLVLNRWGNKCYFDSGLGCIFIFVHLLCVVCFFFRAVIFDLHFANDMLTAILTE